MSATPRDALKQRPQRLGEVYDLIYKKAGQANSQCVTFGGDLLVGTDTHKFAIGPVAYVVGQSEVINLSVSADQTVAATVASGTFLKVLVELDAAGVVTQTIGQGVSTSQADAVLPKGNTGRITIGWLELTNFTPGTTTVTTAMLKKMAYWTWTQNLAPGNNGF